MSVRVSKTQAYDHVVSQERFKVQLTKMTAGSGGTSDIYYALGNEQVYGMGAYVAVAGTSTITTTDTVGTAGQLGLAISTNTGTAATSLTAYRVSGTNTTTASPFAIGTGAGAVANNWTQLSTATGGVPLSAGDKLYFVSGTDATATQVPWLEFTVQPVNGFVGA